MEQTSKYFSKTAAALQNLNTLAASLDIAAEEELTSKAELEANLTMLKEEIKQKAKRIDGIIENLNGALK